MAKKIIFQVFLLTLALQLSRAQTRDSILHSYLQLGIENNLSLLKSKDSYEKQLAVLQEAKGKFLPKIELGARFTKAEGGRAINLRTGELMNPVFQNLNYINQTLYGHLPPEMQPPLYPELQDEEIHFMRPTEQETMLRLTQPLLNHGISINKKIQIHQAEYASISYDANRRSFVKTFSEAYYNYLKAHNVKIVLTKSIKLVDENIRVSEKLVLNDKATKDAIFLAEGKKAELMQKLATANKNLRASQAYLNFLLNRDLNTHINIPNDSIIEEPKLSVNVFEMPNLGKRLELTQMDHYLSITEQQIRLKNNEFLPKLTFQADYGIQGEQYDINSNADYAIASVVLRWDLFDGFQKRAQKKQLVISNRIANHERKELSMKFEMETTNAYHELIESIESYNASCMGFVSTQKAFKMIKRKYEEGISSQIEYFEAQNNLQEAAVAKIVDYYDIQIKDIQLKYVNAEPLAIN